MKRHGLIGALVLCSGATGGCACGQTEHVALEVALIVSPEIALPLSAADCEDLCRQRLNLEAVTACTQVDSAALEPTHDSADTGDAAVQTALIIHCEGTSRTECE